MDFVRPVEAVIPGAQGQILAVLAETTAELNVRTIARLSGVSVAQASRVLPRLVQLGVVERREVPPSSLFRLVRAHVAVGPVLALARVSDAVVEAMGRAAASLVVAPVSVIVFGSFARGEADAESDIDVVFVRPEDVAAGDEVWFEGMESWRERVRVASGNRVEVLEVGATEIGALLDRGGPVWQDISRDGRVVYGLSLDELRAETRG